MKRYPEPGNWIDNMPKGMVIQEPSSPTTKMLSSTDIKEWVSEEGLGFCLYVAIPPEKVADKRLRRLWIETRQGMQAIVEHLETVKRCLPKQKKKRKIKPLRIVSLGDDLEETEI